MIKHFALLLFSMVSMLSTYGQATDQSFLKSQLATHTTDELPATVANPYMTNANITLANSSILISIAANKTSDSIYHIADSLASDISKIKHVVFTPSTGNTITLTNNFLNIVKPSGTLLALTVTLPSSPANNDRVEIKFTQIITTITYSGGTVVAPLLNASLGQYIKLIYDTSTSSWY